MKKGMMIIVLLSYPIYSMYKIKSFESCYYGTIICIKEETKFDIHKFPILIIDKNNYYTQLQQCLQMYGKKAAIATYGLGAAAPIEQACSINHILYFVYNNPGVYSRIEFIVKNKEEVEKSKENLQYAIDLSHMQIKSIY